MKVSSVEELVSLVNRVPDDPLCDMGVGSDSKGSPEIKIETVKGRLFQFPLHGLNPDLTYALCWALGEAIKLGLPRWQEPFLNPDTQQELADFVGITTVVRRTPKIAGGDLQYYKTPFHFKAGDNDPSGYRVKSACPKCHAKTTRKIPVGWVRHHLGNTGDFLDTPRFHIQCKKCEWGWVVHFRISVEIKPVHYFNKDYEILGCWSVDRLGCGSGTFFVVRGTRDQLENSVKGLK